MHIYIYVCVYIYICVFFGGEGEGEREREREREIEREGDRERERERELDEDERENNCILELVSSVSSGTSPTSSPLSSIDPAMKLFECPLAFVRAYLRCKVLSLVIFITLISVTVEVSDPSSLTCRAAAGWIRKGCSDLDTSFSPFLSPLRAQFFFFWGGAGCAGLESLGLLGAASRTGLGIR